MALECKQQREEAMSIKALECKQQQLVLARTSAVSWARVLPMLDLGPELVPLLALQGRHRCGDASAATPSPSAWRTWPIRRPVLSALVLQDPKGVYLRPASHHALRALSCLVLPMLDLGPEPVPLLALQGRQRCGNACAATPSPSASTDDGRAVQ